MRFLSLSMLSLAVIALQACATDPGDETNAGADAITAAAPIDAGTLLFQLLPGAGAHGGGGGGLVVRKQGTVSCVVASIAAPGGPVSTTVGCEANGSATTLRDDEAQRVFDFLSVNAKGHHGGGGIALRKEALVRCTQMTAAPPGGESWTQTTCTSSEVSPPPAVCATNEITFAKESGCQNDGSVEFCIRRGDNATLAAVREIASNVTCSRFGGGRARCDQASQQLCFYPTGAGECLATPGALNERAWGEICGIANLDAVTKIVPTWFE